ncbi:MAG: BON domain-containing protein [Pyrinomonadaceae bacterium]
MRKLRNILTISAAIFVLSIVNVSAQSYSLASTKSVKSTEQQIAKKLRGLPYYGLFDNITYQVNGTSVILSGKVYTLGTKRDAVAAVRDIPGVSNVVNNIQDLPPSSFDDRIRRQAYNIFTSRGPAQYFSTINPDVRIIVERGRIFLEGFVTRESDSNTLNILALGIPGVFEVQNNLIVGRDVDR